MSSDREVLTVRILERDYTISCLSEERESLMAAARELNKRMQEMRGTARALGSERMAVVAALNIIHEREQVKSSQRDAIDSARREVGRLESKLDAVIGRRETG